MAQLVTDERQPAEEILEHADAEVEPDTSPMRYDVRYHFSEFQVFLAGFLGVAAIAAGIVCGLAFANN